MVGAAWATPKRAIAAASIDATVTNNRMRFIRVLPFHEGRGDLPRQLANSTTLATIGTRRITQLQYLLQLSSPTSENPQNANFAFKEFYEVRSQACNTGSGRSYEPRIHLLRTRLNKGRKAEASNIAPA